MYASTSLPVPGSPRPGSTRRHDFATGRRALSGVADRLDRCAFSRVWNINALAQDRVAVDVIFIYSLPPLSIDDPDFAIPDYLMRDHHAVMRDLCTSKLVPFDLCMHTASDAVTAIKDDEVARRGSLVMTVVPSLAARRSLEDTDIVMTINEFLRVLASKSEALEVFGLNQEGLDTHHPKLKQIQICVYQGGAGDDRMWKFQNDRATTPPKSWLHLLRPPRLLDFMFMRYPVRLPLVVRVIGVLWLSPTGSCAPSGSTKLANRDEIPFVSPGLRPLGPAGCELRERSKSRKFRLKREMSIVSLRSWRQEIIGLQSLEYELD
ncbi:hypothetical protein C8Q74DRAFT_1215706 [Fomes fomentarius]|nr:hypothetical protein C8Q74DRAFT_1215706 [Fomes fomentarius]